MRTGRAAVLSTAVLALAGLVPAGRAEGGIIITREGKVIIGRILKEEVTEEGVRVHWPYKENKTRGTFFIQKNLLRWYDIDLDEPSGEYWDKHGNDPIDAVWLQHRDRYLASKQKSTSEADLKLILENISRPNLARLSPLSIPFRMGSSEIQIRKPEGWQRQEVNGILMLVSDQKGLDGVTPRIHIFSVQAASATPSEQVGWLRAELLKIAGSADAFEGRDEEGPKVTAKGGFDYTITTTMRRSGAKPVAALRQLFFRENRTYFYSAYAHEKEYDKYSILFRACLQSMVINDSGTEKPATPPSPGGGAGEAPKDGAKPGEKAPEGPKPGGKPSGG